MTLRCVAHEILGWDYTRDSARRLLRILKRQAPQALLKPGPHASSSYYTTMALLKDHCPELFCKRDAMISVVRRQMVEITEELEDLRLMNNKLAAELRTMRQSERRQTPPRTY